MTEPRKTLKLWPAIGRRVERGHLWVFANEVQTASGDPAPGDEVSVLDAKGRFLGMGLYSHSSLIRARIYSRTGDERCDGEFIVRRVRQSLEFRRSLGGPLPHSYRLLHSESDGLPGAVVDVYGDHVVAQVSTAAMEQRREALFAALIEVLAPRALVERSDMASRELEGLEPRAGVVHGEPVVPCPVRENGVTMLADLLEGQKTGYFLDQVRNRSLAAPYMRGQRVLDLFCHTGAWSIVATAAGASETLGIDTSHKALDLARQSAELNGFANEQCSFQAGDVFALLREFEARKSRYDVIVLDPPALAKSRKDAQNALRAYRELNLRAMRILSPGGLLITCSCSHAVSAHDFREMLSLAARDARADLSVLLEASQPPDHPVHLQTPETAYLKVFFLRRRGF
jgi:23S rRNA (cytosine1962-C5)-methyltransferase